MRAALVLLAIAACGGAPPSQRFAPPAPAQRFAPPAPAPTFADPARRAKLATAYGELDAYFRGFFEKSGAPSVGVGLVVDGELAWSRAYGVQDLASQAPASIDSVYRIGSITKTFTAAAVLALRDEGRLALDAPAATLVPALASVLYPTTDAPPITVRHLLLHTSGLPDVPEGLGDAGHAPSAADVARALAASRLASAPGTTWSYSGMGYAALGDAIARASGTSYRAFVGARLLAPLGMHATTWDAADVPAARLTTGYAEGAPVVPWRFGAMEPAGGLFSSVRDMARWLTLHLDAWPPRSSPDEGPVRRSSLREMHVPQGVERAISADLEPKVYADGYGFAWRSGVACKMGLSIGHSGGTEGHSALVFAFPEHGAGIVILANARDVSFQGVRVAAWRILHATGGLSPRGGPDDPRCPP